MRQRLLLLHTPPWLPSPCRTGLMPPEETREGGTMGYGTAACHTLLCIPTDTQDPDAERWASRLPPGFQCLEVLQAVPDGLLCLIPARAGHCCYQQNSCHSCQTAAVPIRYTLLRSNSHYSDQTAAILIITL